MAGEMTRDKFMEKHCPFVFNTDKGVCIHDIWIIDLDTLLAETKRQARRAALEEARDAQCIDCGCGGAIHSRNPLYHAYQSDLDGVEKFGPKCHADEIRKLLAEDGEGE